MPDPQIQEPNDVIIGVTSTAICGSDLHLYGVLGPHLKPGDVLGHEAIGTVEETSPEISNLQTGDRVVITFNISCGTARCAAARCSPSARPRSYVSKPGKGPLNVVAPMP